MFVSQMWRRATFCIGYLIPYVAWGILLVVLALALYDLLKAGAPAVAQIATAIGLIWAGLVIASGMVAILGIRVVGELYGSDAAQAGAVWAPVETVVGGLGGAAGEILGGVWLVLIGWAALRARELPRALSFLGIVLGVAGILTVVPPLEPASFLYGLGLIVWFVWLGIVTLHTNRRRASRTPAREAA
jgi:MFS family permease